MSREKLQKARNLIIAKRYDEARKILHKLDDPTARMWLEKLDEVGTPAPTKKASTPIDPTKLVHKAQLLIIARKYKQAKAILAQVDLPIAQQWLEKLENLNRDDWFWPELWLDMYQFNLDTMAGKKIENWACSHCKRTMGSEDLFHCPDRFDSHCPLTLVTQVVPERDNLVAVLVATNQREQAQASDIIKAQSLATLKSWQMLLGRQEGAVRSDPRNKIVSAVLDYLTKLIDEYNKPPDLSQYQ